MVFYLVTGVNRGIGFSILEQLSQDKSNTVIGTVRSLDKAQKITDLKRSNVHLIEIDMASDQETFVEAFKSLDKYAPKGLDVVIHNAGVLGALNMVPLDVYKAEDYIYPFEINCVGSIKLYKAVSPYLYKGEGQKKVAFVSSLAGQLTDSFMVFNGYGASKAALNFFMRQVHLDNQNSEDPLKKDAVVYSIHPGMVDTDMATLATGGNRDLLVQYGAITPEQSAADIIKSLDVAKSGTFISHEESKVLPF